MKFIKTFFILLIFGINANAQQIECEKLIADYVSQVEQLHQPRIDAIKEIIAKLEKRGLDPTKTYDVETDSDIDYVSFLNATEKLKEQDLDRISIEIESCDDAKSLQNFMQTIFEGILLYYSDGYSYFLPDNMKYVDWNLVLSGHITGGENSFVNQSKTDFYKMVGWGEENAFRKLLDNPLQPDKWGKIKVKAPKIKIDNPTITVGTPTIKVEKPSGKIFGKKWSF